MRNVSITLLCVTMLAGGNLAQTQESSKASNASDATKSSNDRQPPWMQYLAASLAEYELASTSLPKQKFTLTDQPVLVHADPIEGEERGLLYLWKASDGRPVAAITGILMRFSKGDAAWDELHEYHSLWHKPLRMQADRSVKWQPSEAGVVWKKFSVDSRATKSARMKQLQIKKASRRFDARMQYRGRGEWNLRRIDKPIYDYEYKDEKEQTVVGSVFAFCRSTDPEVLLLLESRTKGDKIEWYWASACFAGDSSYLSLDGEEVWRDERPRFGSNLKHSSHFKDRTFNYVEALKQIKQKDKSK